MKLEEEKGPKNERRPYLSTLVDKLPEAEKWRLSIIRDVAKKVSQIQNAGLGEFKLRDLNDEINKLLREKVLDKVHFYWFLGIRINLLLFYVSFL
jgi:pre-mRNA-splicing factor ISY1